MGGRVVAMVVDERIGGEERCLIVAGGRFGGGGEVKLWESSITNRSLVNRKHQNEKEK